MSFIKKINQNKYVSVIKYGVVIWILMVLIFIYLLYADLTSAPEFIYSQF